eukprot:TRINITY_DN9652_c0_g1_i1.p1 TRINITY_DN9652_c0_g1~~TRINITY_DN9652_c0_g1_i1.p1  ORF type:complete len:597 (+),score=142.01 TRINITY_DN9652_c0_g1_i1:34-1791(+)
MAATAAVGTLGNGGGSLMSRFFSSFVGFDTCTSCCQSNTAQLGAEFLTPSPALTPALSPTKALRANLQQKSNVGVVLGTPTVEWEPVQDIRALHDQEQVTLVGACQGKVGFPGVFKAEKTPPSNGVWMQRQPVGTAAKVEELGSPPPRADGVDEEIAELEAEEQKQSQQRQLRRKREEQQQQLEETGLAREDTAGGLAKETPLEPVANPVPVPGQGDRLDKVAGAVEAQNADNGYETFADTLEVKDLPIVVFSDDLSEQMIWRHGSICKGCVHRKQSPPDLVVGEPVMMSPSHLSFSLSPEDNRYLHYCNVGIVFTRPSEATFMQPSIDTLMVCQGLKTLFDEGLSKAVSRAVDVGSGSGFIGKFIAAKAPGTDNLQLVLADIDPQAMQYCKSDGFNRIDQSLGGRSVKWTMHAGDALKLLDADSKFDLIVSNPPYIPTPDEVKGKKPKGKQPSGFWEGVGLVSYLVEKLVKKKFQDGCHLVMMVTSLTLKAPAVKIAFNTAVKRGVKMRVLCEREIAWKAFYAGPAELDHLLATTTERTTRQTIGGCDFFVGATKPGESREGTYGRDFLKYFHWHVGYVLVLHF